MRRKQEDQGQQSARNETGKGLPNCSINRTRIPPFHYPFNHSGPVISSLGSRGNFLTNSNDTEAEKRVNNVIVTKRRSHKAASQDWGRASRYALIELPRKPSAANDKGAPNMGIQRTRIPASRYPFGHSGPLIPGVRLPYSPVILLLNISIAILFHPGLYRLSIALILLILVEFFFIIHLLVASILL